MKQKRYLLGLALAATVVACNQPEKAGMNEGNESTETVSNEASDAATHKDVHSYAQPEEVSVSHLNLEIDVDFDQKVISGTATYDLNNHTGASEVIFDTRELTVSKVVLDGAEETTFEIGEADPFLGSPLTIAIQPETKKVSITYASSNKAKALQWLSAQQTAGKKQPFLFTQSQAILARTWLPCQDGPGMRATYTATVTVPKGMMAVMSATNPTEKNEEGVYNFEMRQPIPSYLMALAVGDLVFRPIGERTGVYGEPEIMEKAVYEFGEMEQMLESAEALYGAYAWERYDLIVLPPSFPFGGMENPRLTFATPTIIAGDRSLTALVAHELAHSWSGNLVTNLTWNDFWLNEGFTVYFERRIMESLYGKDYADMLAILGYQDLEHSVADLGADKPDTHLKLDLDHRDPDDGMTDIAYEKGYFFLRMLEDAQGREKFDDFLKTYFTSHAFQSMHTEGFLEYLIENLLDGNEQLAKDLKINDWVYGPGIPDNCPTVSSARFEQVDAARTAWQDGTAAADLDVDAWTTHEWLQFLRKLPADLTMEQMSELDAAFGFTKSGNNEILAAWFVNTINNGYTPADAAVEKFLVSVGRRKFLTPLYKALVAADPSKEKARAIYAKARPNYHSVSTATMDELLDWSAS